MLKLKYIITLLLSVMISSAYTQIDKEIEKKLKTKKTKIKSDSLSWNNGFIINLGLNRVGLYNWAGGGQNSMSINGLISYNVNYSHLNTTWDNNFDIAYGVLKSGYGPEIPWFKNDDRIELNSKLGHKANEKWDYSALINFRTQFTYGYNNTDESLNNNYFSNFLSPAYQVIAIGFDYKPNVDFTCFISPITLKMTMVIDDSLSNIGAFGVEKGEKIRTETGGYLNISYQKKEPLNIKDVTFKTKLSLFSNYLESPQNIDITWETLSSLKFKKYFSITISTYLIYDHDIEITRYHNDGTPIFLTRNNGSFYLDNDGNPIPKKGPITQFKEAFSLGVSFSF